MTCKNGACKYEFCWVCCGAWKDHSGSFYACNKYDPDKDKDNPDAKKKNRWGATEHAGWGLRGAQGDDDGRGW